MKVVMVFITAFLFSCNPGLLAQDLLKSRIAIIGLTGSINEDVLSGLDSRNTTSLPYTKEEKALQTRINNRLEKFLLDDTYHIVQKRMEEKGMQLEPLSTSDKLARLNEKGYPNPLIPKSVIKKKNDDYADYFLNINIVCSKPLIGGLAGFKTASRVRIVLYDGTGQKIKTINEEVKDSSPVKDTDFDEEWTVTIERFNRLDWYAVRELEKRLLPVIEAAIHQGLDQL